ncbi:putative short chain dehydrogenase [Pyrenochaeta sp. DS3sAY3a]|nr:putative short chain dehydrogenase [Pyrenochaeta sp. DS3sAY3a]
MANIQGSKAVVVGGTHGIGLATAQLLASGGTTVIITGRKHDTLQEIRKAFVERTVIQECDITIPDSVARLADKVSETFGTGPQLDFVFINAGYAKLEPFVQVSHASFRKTFDTNVFGAFITAQALSPLIKPGGSIVFTTSIANRRGIPNMSVYAASKAAVHSLVQTLAAELAPCRIRVNAVNPGFIKTPTMGVDGISKEDVAIFEAQGAQLTPLGRIGDPGEVAKAVVFLGYEATFSTGSEVVVDGGLLWLANETH